jgi:Carboxypeptidase regulatory-like domain/TonB dependent receptor
MERIQTRSLLSSSGFAPFVLLLMLSVVLSTMANAQSTAVLNGTVMDASGAAITGAKVIAINQSTGFQISSQTDSSGAYLFPSLPIGTYKIEVSASGFQKGVIADLRLRVATTTTQNVQLKIGQVSELVEITADAAIVDTTTNSVGQVINDKTVQEIPLNGRHFTDLSLLTPGTVTPPQNGFLSAPLRGQGSFGINTAGQREDTTNWLVNGINLNDPVQNQLTFQPPIDTLAEYKIDNSTFSAQYGRNAGAIVNLATRSGTNDFHGEAFDFFRNDALDARNFFNRTTSATGAPQPQAPFKRNDFGAAFGGPIKRNKAFFFLAYEGLRQRQGLTISSTVPTAADIATVTSPAVKQLLALVPAANTLGNTGLLDVFTGSASANVQLNQGSADIDYEVSSKDHLHGYVVIQKDLRQEPTQNANLPGFGDTRDGFRSLATVSDDHNFSSTMTNTIRLGYNRIHLFFTPTALDPTTFDINMPAGAPGLVGLPNIIVTGAMQFGGPQLEPQGRGDTTVALNDTFSWLKGAHSLALGGEIRRAYNNNVAENIGSFTYPSLTSFLSDSATNFTVLLGAGNDKILEPSYGVFAQDSYKWKQNFTVNFGLRYEWNSTPSEAADRFSTFDLATGTIKLASPYQTNNKNFEPRVGFAWDPLKNGKTVVRGGYAIMAQNPTTNIVSPLSGNPPFALPLNTVAAAITLENPAAAVTAVSLGPTSINPNFKNMYAQDWNLTVERQLKPSLGISLAYVGTKGTHLQITENENQPLLLPNGDYGTVRPFQTLPLNSPVLPAQCAAPNAPCTFGTLNRIDSPGNSNYNAFWATVNKHLSHGFEFLASYTWSKSFDYNSLSTGETVLLQNAYNPRGDYGLSEFDVRNRMVISGFYQLPFKHGRLFSGWQLGVVNQAQSGSPITPFLVAAVGPGINLTIRPDVTGSVQVTGSPFQWFGNKSVFQSPCTGPNACHPGDMQRDSIIGPNFINTDFNVTKDTKITERLNLQFRTEFFDIFNHPNFGNPNLNTTSSTFGQVTSTRFPGGDFGSAREIQFAMKLMF